MAAYIQFTSRLKSTTQDGILAEAQQIAVSSSDNTSIKSYIDSKVASAAGAAYRPKGSVTFAALSALTSANVGDVYNITDSFTLSGKNYAAGSNVACLKAFSSKVTPDETYWDVLGGFIDLSPYAKSTELNTAKSDLQGKIDATNANVSSLARTLDERITGQVKIVNNGDGTFLMSDEEDNSPVKLGGHSSLGQGIIIGPSTDNRSGGESGIKFTRADAPEFEDSDVFSVFTMGSGTCIHVDDDNELVFRGNTVIDSPEGMPCITFNGNASFGRDIYIGSGAQIGENAVFERDVNIGVEVYIGTSFYDDKNVCICGHTAIAPGENIEASLHNNYFIVGNNGIQLGCENGSNINIGGNGEIHLSKDAITFGTTADTGSNTKRYEFTQIIPGTDALRIISNYGTNINRNTLDFKIGGKVNISPNVSIGEDTTIGGGVTIPAGCNLNQLQVSNGVFGYGGSGAFVYLGSGIEINRSMGTNATKANAVGVDGVLITSGMALTSSSSGELWFGTSPTVSKGRKKVAFAEDVEVAQASVTELTKRVAALESLLTVAS